MSILLALSAAGACAQSPQDAPAPQAETTAAAGGDAPAGRQQKVALLIGLSNYLPSTRWAQLNTGPDLVRMRAALVAQGFDDGNIHDLEDSDADRSGIEAAFRKHLIDGVAEGGIAVFHYSGHGHRLTDDDHDEIDGYDEVLVPFDAPQKPAEGYDGAKHVRDDDLHLWLQELRRAAGSDGDVIISLDSCFSGSAMRAVAPTATARGSLTPIGPPQTPLSGELGADVAGGFDESGSRGAAAAGAGEPGLSNYVFFSAARHDELAFETRNEEHQKMGSLSYALGGALAKADSGDTYRKLFDQVRSVMAAKVRNQPQAEGQLDRGILAGQARTQEAFLKIAQYDAASGTAKVEGGVLAALMAGSRVVVHEQGAAQANPDQALARGEVTAAGPFLSDVKLDSVVEGADVQNGWVFVTDRVYGSSGVRVRLDGSGAWRGPLETALGGKKWATLTETDEDVVVTARDGELIAATSNDVPLFSGSLAANDAALAHRLVRRLDDYSRNYWLRQIDERSRDLDVLLELTPCRLENATSAFGESIVRCAEPIDRMTPGGNLELQIGDGFELAVSNRGRKKAHLAVLDLWPDGQIHQIWPEREHEGADSVLDPGETFEIDVVFEVGEPTGSEMLKLMAADQHVDYRPITTDNFVQEGSRGVMDTLFADAFAGTRAAPRATASSVGTFSLPITVVERTD